MQKSFSSDIAYLVGSGDIIAEMQVTPALPLFSDLVVSFFDSVSKNILRNKMSKVYSDVVTFGFWCRRANILSLAADFSLKNRIGKGITFHIAPSNVPVNFAYSLIAGALAGNCNIVRVPSKSFPQVDLICNAISECLGDFPEMNSRICLVRYGRGSVATDELSAICDTRVIWGGDNTIAEIRKSPIKARTNEITFADRYSICLINAEKYLASYDAEKTALDFYNDTYFSDQNACTSPKVVVWMGGAEEIAIAKQTFWASLQKLANDKYDLQPIQAVDKCTLLFEAAAMLDAVLRKSEGENNKLYRIDVDRLSADLMKFQGNSGFFYEYTAKSLEEILPICTDKCQTLAYIGMEPEELRDFVIANAPRGIDRIVPVGKTMDFSLIWDGVDIIRALSRVVSI